MSGTPGPWMGIYSGTSATAPTHYTDYEWNEVKGPQGDDYVLTAADKAEIAGIAAGELQPTITELDENKADKNGDYLDMTAGNADQLLATVGPTDQVPYLLRASGGGVTAGDREVDKIIGGTVAWNQLVNTDSETVTVDSGDVYFARISGVESIGVSDGTAISVTGGTDNVIDLTLALRTTIANYINTLETATPGAGVAWFRELFPKEYYAYDAGTLRSVQVSAHVMRNADDEIIGNYPLDPSLTLYGFPLLDSDNRLYYGGDTYDSDGKVTRKFVKETLNGTESWNLVSDNNNYFSHRVGVYGSVVGGRIVADKLKNASIISASTNIGINLSNSSGQDRAQISIRPEGYATMTETEFKTWLSNNPVTVVYEVVTPTIEAATPYQNPQIVDAAGTEQYIDAGNRDVEIPVGHETFYPENLREKIEDAPDNPTADGDYLMHRENGMNSYAAIPGTVTVSGTTPIITAVDGTRYVCGEVATLDITLPDSGIVDVIFQSGSTAAVLTVIPPTGKTLSWANGFDPTSLDANTTYELNIAIVGDQCLGVAAKWGVSA